MIGSSKKVNIQNYRIMRLETLHLLLKEYIEHEEKLKRVYPASAEYNVPTWNNIYDALKSIESILDFTETLSDQDLEGGDFT